MNKKFLHISLAAILSAMLIIILYKYAENQKSQKNSFIRNFPPHIITDFKAIDLRYNSYYISGIFKNNLYLGNYTSPSLLFKCGLNFADTNSFHIRFNKSQMLIAQHLKLKVKDSIVYLTDDSKSLIFQTSITSLLFSDPIHINTQYIEEFQPLNSATTIIKRYDPAKKLLVISKINEDGSIFTPAEVSLKKQIDGHFCVDGILLYSSYTSNLVYVFYYRNQFLRIDTNINVISTAKTLDSNSFAKIKLASYTVNEKERSETFKTPPLVVNQAASLFNDKLFIHSTLIADNQDKDEFRNSSTIDLYDILSGKYIYSFYLPDYNGIRMKEFQIHGSEVFVLYDNYLVKFRINYPK